jgi:hypothetical protein
MHVEVRRGPLQGPDRERQGPTNRMSAATFSGSPHSTRASMSDRTERQVTSEAADEAAGTRRAYGRWWTAAQGPRQRCVTRPLIDPGPARAGRCAEGTVTRSHVVSDPLRDVQLIARAGSRRTRRFHARGSAAHPGSAGWHAPPPRRPASRTPCDHCAIPLRTRSGPCNRSRLPTRIRDRTRECWAARRIALRDRLTDGVAIGAISTASEGRGSRQTIVGSCA